MDQNLTASERGNGKLNGHEGAKKNGFIDTVLDKWIPAFITAIIGGFVVGLLVPHINTIYTRENSLIERQLNIWDRLAISFTEFTNARENFILFEARQQRIHGMSGEALESEDYLKPAIELNARWQEKLRNLAPLLTLAKYYFGDDVTEIVEEFQEWHPRQEEAREGKPASEWTPTSEYVEWRERLLDAVRKSLQG